PAGSRTEGLSVSRTGASTGRAKDAYDVTVVGSGHNALVAAAYLARAGRSVLVLERNDRAGGLVRTDELTLPGFKHDGYAASHRLFVTGAAYRDSAADLGKRGLRYLNTDIPTGVSFADGRTGVLYCSLEDSIAEAERLAPGDGAVLRGLVESFGPYVGDVFRLFSLDLASAEATGIMGRLTRSETGAGYSPFVQMLFETARNVVGPLRSPVTRAMLAPWVGHLGRSPDEVGSGIWVVLAVLALMAGGMPTPQGGSERLAEALVRLIGDNGGVVRLGTPVSRILLERGRAV